MPVTIRKRFDLRLGDVHENKDSTHRGHPDFRKIFGFYLRNMGYEPIEAQDGREGMYYARNVRPDLIILDLGLPDLSGLAVLALIKQDLTTAVIPIVILTAMAMNDIRKKA